jgi:hypothetical protein
MKNSVTVLEKRRIYMTGGDTHYATIRIPKWISDKYGLNDKTVIEFVEMESEGGVLIKKST